MRCLLYWILTAVSICQVLAPNSSSIMPPNTTITTPPTTTIITTTEYVRVQYCKWPCECPSSPPVCPPGVSVVTDGCDCCKTCARQRGENCTEADTCDPHKGLYCDYSRDYPRYEVGVCGQMMGVGCVLNGIRYSNGQSFQPNCKYNCTCVDGAVGCVPLCMSRPPLVWCQNPKRVKMTGKCCEKWVCDDIKKPRKASPRHIASPVYREESETWQNNCITQTTPWSPCSKTCGMGIATRISNDNDKCRLHTESRLCNLRPCEVDITKHFRPGKKCLSVYREPEPKNLTISGCVSRRAYRPKYCGVCTDERCCTPYKSKTIRVHYDCPDGTSVSWNVQWINACFCNLGCRKIDDIFSQLVSYHDYSEIMN